LKHLHVSVVVDMPLLIQCHRFIAYTLITYLVSFLIVTVS